MYSMHCLCTLLFNCASDVCLVMKARVLLMKVIAWKVMTIIQWSLHALTLRSKTVFEDKLWTVQILRWNFLNHEWARQQCSLTRNFFIDHRNMYIPVATGNCWKTLLWLKWQRMGTDAFFSEIFCTFVHAWDSRCTLSNFKAKFMSLQTCLSFSDLHSFPQLVILFHQATLW